ncbi:GGDEF domain-containing protein [Chitinolyticbacter meiyuanensis]|uniref:GGDEF domain-containing protein n=1 Tax=Chitinolyticbacter meiyuanensis TaxID=682798 RepID=UPI0011E5D34B|nr:GGDEF domain-containing protein [Chitinolyticbacter meiyuanensis]
MTSPTPSVNPVEIARIALKRLAERGLAPTPENYAQFYNAIVTIKSPETKNSDELQHAWQVLCRLDDALAEAADTTASLLESLSESGQSMATSLGQLQYARRTGFEPTAEMGETSATVAGLLEDIISSTHTLHATVSASHEDISTIRDSVKRIEEDLAFNRKLLEQDPLTGTLNRQGLDHLLAREVKRAHRAGSKLSVVLFDLDDFKQINDRFGHLVGDQVLVHVANLARAVLRESDMLVRYGGEEFLLLLPETDINGARFVVDRMRLVAGKTPFMHHAQRIDVSFSSGVAMLGAEENGRALVLRADEALYRAKHSGRGRVEMAD